MQKKSFMPASLLLAACTMLALTGCFKGDSAMKQYKIFTPVLQTNQEVRDNVRSHAPRAVNSPGKMYLFGNYIFLNELNQGIHIIDNSDPASPVNKAFINIPGNVDIAVKGNTLYADCYMDLFAIDISDINHVSLKSYLTDIFPERRNVGGYYMPTGKMIVDWQARDTAMQIEIKEGQGIWQNDVLVTGGMMPWLFNLATLTTASAPATGVGGSMARFAIVGNYMYAVTTSQLKTLDISNTAQPQLAGTKAIGWQIETIYPFRNKLFIGSQTGMYIFDLANPTAPSQGMMFGHARACDPVVADDNYAYVTLHSGSSMCWTTNNELNVVNIQNLNSPYLAKSYPLSNPYGLSKQGNILFVCDGNDGLKVFDATDANNIQLKNKISMEEAFDVIAINNLAIVSAKSGLYQYRFTNASDVKLLSRIRVQ